MKERNNYGLPEPGFGYLSLYHRQAYRFNCGRRERVLGTETAFGRGKHAFGEGAAP